jgi:hypothetical protein
MTLMVKHRVRATLEIPGVDITCWSWVCIADCSSEISCMVRSCRAAKRGIVDLTCLNFY